MRYKKSATRLFLFSKSSGWFTDTKRLLSCLFFNFKSWVSSSTLVWGLLTFSRLVNSIGKIFEHFINVGSTFCRYYEMRGVVLFSKRFSLLVTNNSKILKIGFIACNCDDDFWWRVFLKLLDPFFYSLKWLSWNYLISYNGTHCIFVINRGDGVVFLLTSGILF